MLDFMMASSRSTKKGTTEIYPKFIVGPSKDLMIRGGDFYAIWNDAENLWSTKEEVALYLIDQELDKYAESYKEGSEDHVKVLHMWDAESGQIDKWHKYVQKQMRDSFHPLDEKLIFSNIKTKKTDYASKTLSYPLAECETPCYEKLISTLYSEEERRKIEWAIGAVVSGDSKKIQKFMVFYGPPASGKSTILNIVQSLFDGYYCAFDSRALGSANNAFALEAFRSNPLVAIQHDGDLSRIEDNTRLNSLVSHEMMTVNEKFRSTYATRFNCFLFMGTNKPVKITDAKSGILRRLIDISPTGKKIKPLSEYLRLTSQIDFELGGIAMHCLNVYKENPTLYNDYIPTMMLGASNDFYNFILYSYDKLKRDDCITLKQAWEDYNDYCDKANITYREKLSPFKEELKSYFRDFQERSSVEGRPRNYYSGFIFDKFLNPVVVKEPIKEPEKLKFENDISIFDTICADCPAQYANDDERPTRKWVNVKTKLSDIDTSKLHYVQVPDNHIVIDFDLKDEDGNKSFDLNAIAAAKWPPTYAELSKSGEGIHLHYIYDGDVSQLSNIYDVNIEIKVFTGDSSLRRKLTKCNDLPIATINTGLPLREKKKMINFEGFKNEKALTTFVRNAIINKTGGGTKPAIEFINKGLNQAYDSGITYDISSMKRDLLDFAYNSSHHSDYCLDIVRSMKLMSADKVEEAKELEEAAIVVNDETGIIIFFDVEVFCNLFILVYKQAGPDKSCVKLINPSSDDIENLFESGKFRFVGFNCRRYDNHILYARMLGYSNQELYELSQNIIKNGKGFFPNAYNWSYTDIYDYYGAKDMSLKKWEFKLGEDHVELEFPWDQPLDKDKWDIAAEYCANDVRATEAVWNATQAQFSARKMLAAIAPGIPNDTTNMLTTRMIFGKEKNPKLVYTDLSKEFPGYRYEKASESEDKKRHNWYRDIDLGFGGYVYSNPGMYQNVALLDVESLHPHSIIELNLFGDYTEKYKNLLQTRLCIKHKEFDKARRMMNGIFAPYLNDESQAKELSNALKLAINSVYGLTSASFDNPFRDPRNENNIVALRGALFMKTLQDEVTARGYTVIHIKTDSIKIANADNDIIQFCMDFAKKYGYTFEHEATYDRICLVNDAVYIAKYADGPHEFELPTGEKLMTQWTATGTQFQIPYIFKQVFSKDPLKFEDFCEIKTVTSKLYLDMNENLPEGEHAYRFVGKVGQFCPIKPGHGGGELLREQNGKFNAAVGSTGYRWLESVFIKTNHRESDIDKSYYQKLADKAIEAIKKYGDYEWFVS